MHLGFAGPSEGLGVFSKVRVSREAANLEKNESKKRNEFRTVEDRAPERFS